MFVKRRAAGLLLAPYLKAGKMNAAVPQFNTAGFV